MKLSRVRLAAWAIPIVSFALAAALCVDRHAAFSAAVRRTRALESELSQAYAREDAMGGLKKAARFACAKRSPKEESVFFTGLRRHAALADVTIVRLRSQSETLGDDKGLAGGPPPAATPVGKESPETVIKGVTRVGCQLVLDGSYPALRRFLQGLWKSDRLYTMSDVTWSRAPSGTEMTLTLNRYLAPATPLAPSKEAPNL